MIPRAYFVFDVESVGLHGEGFAVGWVIVTADGDALGEGMSWCYPSEAGSESAEAEVWVDLNIPHEAFNQDKRSRTPRDVRSVFWHAWGDARNYYDAVMAADVAWPVEARFLYDCIRDDPGRAIVGPYPLIDIASVRLGRGLDPLATEPRLPHELPVHDPLADARQSARLLIEALRTDDVGDASTMILDDTPRNLK